jgi:hypothetical protein
MRENRLSQLPRQGQPSNGTHLAISWPSIVDRRARGPLVMFDHVEFVAEYAPYDLSPWRTSAAPSTRYQ